jgi:hypothetical protein
MRYRRLGKVCAGDYLEEGDLGYDFKEGYAIREGFIFTKLIILLWASNGAIGVLSVIAGLIV